MGGNLLEVGLIGYSLDHLNSIFMRGYEMSGSWFPWDNVLSSLSLCTHSDGIQLMGPNNTESMPRVID